MNELAVSRATARCAYQTQKRPKNGCCATITGPGRGFATLRFGAGLETALGSAAVTGAALVSAAATDAALDFEACSSGSCANASRTRAFGGISATSADAGAGAVAC